MSYQEREMPDFVVSVEVLYVNYVCRNAGKCDTESPERIASVMCLDIYIFKS